MAPRCRARRPRRTLPDRRRSTASSRRRPRRGPGESSAYSRLGAPWRCWERSRILDVPQTRHQCLDRDLRVLRASDFDGNHPGLLGRVVVPPGNKASPMKIISAVEMPRTVSELVNPVGLVDARLRYINRSRTPQAHRELRDESIEKRLHLLPLREIGVPLPLLLERGVLSQRGQGDLGATIFYDFTPDLVG